MSGPIEVQGPDGQRYQFPAGTSPEVMKQAMAKRYPKQQSAARPLGSGGAVAGAAMNILEGKPPPPAPRPRPGYDAQMDMFDTIDGYMSNPLVKGIFGFGNAQLNAVTLGNLDGINARVDQGLSLGKTDSIYGGSYQERLAVNRDQRQQMREDAPIASVAGDITGFLVPGAVAAKGLTNSAKLLPWVATGTGKGSQAARYTQRLTGLAALGGAENALYEGTVGASNREAREGRNVGMGERLDMAKDGGTNPIMLAAGPVMSGVYRGGRKLLTGKATPDNIATPSTQVMAQVLDAVPDETSIKSLRLIENLLRNSGLSPDRIGKGFSRINDLRKSSDTSRLSLARLIEREFANEVPEVSDNLRLFLLKVGMDSPKGRQIVTKATDSLRKTQAEDLRGEAAYQLGSQSRLEASNQAKANMQQIGGLYEDALRQAPRDGELVDAALEMMQGYPREVQAALGQRARAAQLSVDQYISQNPLASLHWLQSLVKQSEKPLDQAVAANMTDILDNAVPGYRGLREQYADQAKRRDLVGFVDSGGRERKGFGTDLINRSGKNLTADDLVSRYKALPDEQARAADLSIRDAITDPLRLGKTGGVDEFGRDMAGARLQTLQRDGVIETLSNMLGPRGEALSGKIKNFVDERQFAVDIDPRTGSNTMNKANAQAGGAAPVSGYMGRTLGGADGSIAPSLLLDATLAMTGNIPVATLARGAHPVLGRLFQPRQNTRNALAELLLDQSVKLDPTRSMFSPIGGVPPVNALNDAKLGNNRPPPRLSGDPMRPSSGPVPGGVEDGRYVSPLEAADREAVMAIRNLNAPQQVTRRNRFNTSKSARVPDWDGPIPERPTPLTEWVKRKGGVNDEGGEISSILGGTNTRPGVISNLKRGGQFSISGRSIDDMTQAAIEEGYLPQGSSANDFLDALADDGRDSSVFPIYLRDTNDIYEWQAYVDWANRAGVETPYEAARTAREKRKAGKTGGLFGEERNRLPQGGQNALANEPSSAAPTTASGVNALAKGPAQQN